MISRWRKIVLVVFLSLIALWGLWAIGYVYFRSGEILTFLFLDENLNVCREKTIQVESGTVTVGLVGEPAKGFGPGIVTDFRPYVSVRVEGLPNSYDFVVKAEDVVVKDSEDHRFMIVGTWPNGGRGRSRRYRLDLDAVEFNKHARYYGYGSWVGRKMAWNDPERYTLGLHFPFCHKGVDYVVDISGIVCFVNQNRLGFRRPISSTFGPWPPRKLEVHDWRKYPIVFRAWFIRG